MIYILENACHQSKSKQNIKSVNDYSQEKLKWVKERQNKSNVVSDTTSEQ